jgi:branched-chain amino acid aminotransferase
MLFSLALYPIVYRARYDGASWREEFIEQPHKTPAEEAALSESRARGAQRPRNCFSDVPLVNYNDPVRHGLLRGPQGLPAEKPPLGLGFGDLPRRGEPARFARLCGFGHALIPEELFHPRLRRGIRAQRGPRLQAFVRFGLGGRSLRRGPGVYLRPFSYAEGGIGVGIPKKPSVFVVATPVGSYFKPELPRRSPPSASAPPPRAPAGSSATRTM